MKKFQDWWKKAGFANIGILIAAVILVLFFGKWAFFTHAAVGLFMFWLGLNWQAAKQQTTIDEWVEENYLKIKSEVDTELAELKIKLQEQIDDLKRQLIGLKNKK